MMGNIGERIVKMFWIMLCLVLCLSAALAVALWIGWIQGCSLHVMEKHTHYHGEQRQEERTTDLLERVFDVESTEE